MAPDDRVTRSVHEVITGDCARSRGRHHAEPLHIESAPLDEPSRARITGCGRTTGHPHRATLRRPRGDSVELRAQRSTATNTTTEATQVSWFESVNLFTPRSFVARM